MENSTLVQIIKSIKTNNGIFPSEYEPLIPDLENFLIIWRVNRLNGHVTAEITHALEVYYQRFCLMNSGHFLLRWLHAIYFYALEHKDIENFKENIGKVEKIKKKLIPS